MSPPNKSASSSSTLRRNLRRQINWLSQTGWHGGFVAAVVLLGAQLLINVTAPWTAKHEWNGVVWSQAAHNHLRAGLKTTLGIPSWEHFGPLPIPSKAYYVHHPPLLPLMVTGTFALFGEHEWAARLVPIVCSLLNAVLLWFLVRSAAGERAATLSVAIWVTLPIQLFFGRTVNYEPVALTWMLGAFFCLRQWQLTDSARWRAGVVACFLMGLWTEWHAYILLGVVAGFLLAGRRPREMRLGRTLLALAIASTLLFAVHIRLARADAWEDAWQALALRFSTDRTMVKSRIGDFTWWQWLQQQFQFLGNGIGPVGWGLAITGASCSIAARRLATEGMRWLSWAALCFSVMNALY